MDHRAWVLGSVGLVLLALSPGRVHAQAHTEETRGTGESRVAAHEGAARHEGVFVRMTAGLGGAGARLEEAGLDRGFVGGAGSFALDVGGVVAERLALHLRLRHFVIIHPRLTEDGRNLGAAADATFGFPLFGGGLTYHFMPANAYLGVAVGVALANYLEAGSDPLLSGPGVGVDVDLGKEWWVGDEWALGVAGRFSYARIAPGELSTDERRLRSLGGGLLLSVTYD